MVKLTVTIITWLTVIHFTVFAQREIKGHVYDKDDRKPLQEANVFLFTAEKSILKGQAVTDQHGDFAIKNIPPGNYVLTISFMGYRAATLPVEFTERARLWQIPLPQTGLQKNAITLNSISIKINKPLFIVRKDTIEFSAKDFPTAENASMKNLLQKIPGLTIDQEGNFYYLGRRIRELYINGRPVFSQGPNSSGDPQKISRMLLANLVDKIQIADKKGIDGMIEGGKNEKVINITVKQDMKKKINGAAGAGYGTDGRYNMALNANLFRDDKQIITSGYINNTNAQQGPYSNDDAMAVDNFGRGVSRKKILNGNTSFDLSPKIKLNANLMLYYDHATNDQQLHRENILPDSSFSYNSHSQTNNAASHNALFTNLTILPNDRNTIGLDFSGTISGSKINSQNKYISVGGKNNDTVNSGNTNNTSNNKRNAFAYNGTYTNRSHNKKGTFNILIGINQDNTSSDQHNNTLNFDAGTHSSDTINQEINTTTKTRNINTSVTYQYLIIPELAFALGYKFNEQHTDNDQEAFDFDPIKRGFYRSNKDLTYDFQNDFSNHTFTTGIFRSGKKLDASFNISYISASSNSNNLTLAKQYRQKVNYFSPNFFVTYKIDNYKTLSANFSRDTRPPRISFLPVISTANPLYIQLGNPDLKPTIANSAGIEYRSFSVGGLSFSTNMNLDLQQNAVTQSTSSDSSGKQITQMINTNGNYVIRQSVSLGKRFAKSGLSLNFYTGYDLNHVNTFVNKVQNTTSQFHYQQRLNVSWMYKKFLEVEGMTNMEYTSNTYSIQDNAHYDFLNYLVNLNTNTYLPLDINVGLGTLYVNNTSQHQQFIVMNTWISKTFLPKKSLQAKLYVYDLFRKNQSLSTMQSFTYIEQQTNTILAQYFLFSLSWFFGKSSPAAK
ncbi:outer membrane beta-barrel protein [Chitinophaga sp. Ak27]|uniref:outer membrane beta-barrel protein n=1 Tax=Chitinophaga sp. Ak27 TaxID=2726116 RepID=UPI00145D6B85|nr:outer membrane beta-barrel protein [Chitinophaga sp. Ak27]NLU90961.1 outer membrane beta-barrel protein [Chitinophaga sp. Ak27]